ncbi:conserved hypothetical protein [Aeropyrum pernix K1]|uniref:DUF996 domain-containing protein n=1 Tax=Aeropyrum pernix (strain ATCC 700893 / DSM 11879 / JCM 9820 / NBRC 100138 / K1) TaxID=272557 RepID=Q9YBQ4_AERPE|nr:DUF996 domain-containing protein [Aeropyrum pernix]BAA80544.2 conserved hypothetical protein [Aeropyrum pernix K1]
MTSIPQDIGTARMLGIAGSALVLLGILIPFLSLIGFVLVLVSLYMLSKQMGEESIFRNAVISVVLSIAGFIVFAFLTGASFFAMAGALGSGELTALTAAGIGSLLAGFVILYIAMVASAVFFRRALEALAGRTGVDMFRHAGLAYLVGSITLIVLVGGLILLIAWVLLLVGFIQLRPEQGMETQAAVQEGPGESIGQT